MKQEYKISINNIEFAPERLAHSKLDSTLDCPLILVANTNNFDFEKPRLFNFLNDEEKNKAQKFKAGKAQKTYILSHALNLYFLKKYHFAENETINYQTREFGKPYLKDRPYPCFNISHAENMVALAYFKHEIGVDIEHIKKEKEPIDLVRKKYFSESENKHIEKNYDLFFKYWTKKETVLKTLGCGITDEMKNIETSFLSQNVSIGDGIFKNHDKKKVFIWTWRLNDYYLSLGTEEIFNKIKLVEILPKSIKHLSIQ